MKPTGKPRAEPKTEVTFLDQFTSIFVAVDERCRKATNRTGTGRTEPVMNRTGRTENSAEPVSNRTGPTGRTGNWGRTEPNEPKIGDEPDSDMGIFWVDP